jgi:predicted acylesterase/phospholipase RssA
MKRRKPIRVCIPGGASHAPTLAGGLYYLDTVYDVVAVAGASAGALSAIAYAFGVDLAELTRVLMKLLQKDRVLDRSLGATGRYGRCAWNVIGEAVKELVGAETTLGQALTPLVVVVTDARTSRPVYLSSWATPNVLVWEAAAATSALIPLASMKYIPSYRPGRLYYDGGFTDNNPDHVFDSAPEPTWSFDLVGPDRDGDGQDDEIPLGEWQFDKAAMSVAKSLTYAAGASKSRRTDRVCIPLRAKGSGLDFSLTPDQITDRIRTGWNDTRDFVRSNPLL